MEVEQEQDATIVLDGLIKEDDQSVESWYLGGWCHLLLSQKAGIADDVRATHAQHARDWLGICLKLCRILQYEDVPLREHAEDLVQQLNKSLNLLNEDDEWEDADDDREDESDGEEIEADEDNRHADEDVAMT